MACSTGDSSICSQTHKKLLFLLCLVYFIFVLLYYQCRVQLSIFFSEPIVQGPVNGRIYDGIRYILHLSNVTNSSNDTILDIHLEHPLYGHSGETVNHAPGLLSLRENTIAIGGGLTSKKLNGVTVSNIPNKFQFFTTLLPSFCKTASKGFEYHFYFAYDDNDKVFSNGKLLSHFMDHFSKQMKTLCSYLKPEPQIHFVQCSHTGSPAWAQNDAMMEAYLDGVDYFYRINDDSQLTTSGWTEQFIQVLKSYEPAMVGVVGPKHQGGNQAILTYDFTHRTHVNIFGFYYPRDFPTWWADSWITELYKPGRTTKMSSVGVKHTMKLGQRYKVDMSIRKTVKSVFQRDRKVLQRYLGSLNTAIEPDGTKVVSLSLWGKNPRYTIGSLHCAQQLSRYYPGWVLRVYVPLPNATSDSSLLVPPRIISSLRLLGAQVAFLDPVQMKFPRRLWKLLVADDDKVKYFVVRNADSLFTDREGKAVAEWVESGETFHCMRDHPLHSNQSIVSGLWGARTDHLKQLLSSNIVNFLNQNQDDWQVFENKTLWAKVSGHSLCHDSVSCDVWPPSQPFPTPRKNQEFVGQKYNQFMQIADDLHLMVDDFKGSEQCSEIKNPKKLNTTLSPDKSSQS